MSTPAERTHRATKACGLWLADCLKHGWPRSDLDALEATWWEHHDENGNLVTRPPQAPPKDADDLREALGRLSEAMNNPALAFSGTIEAGLVDYAIEYIHRLQSDVQDLSAHAPDTSAERRDAERYRWLRRSDAYKDVRILFLKEGRWYQSDSDCYLDTNIDAAIASERAGQNNQGEK